MVDLSHFGLGGGNLEQQVTFKPESNNSILLYDGDGACYSCSAGVAKIETALRRFERDIYETMYLAGCDKARVHLTPKGCFKNGRGLLLTHKPYQANRANKQAPALLEVLRSSVAAQYFESNPDIEIILNYEVEADDGLMMDAYVYQNGILVSPDKDLLINPFKSYSKEDGKHSVLNEGDRFGWIDRKFWSTPTGKPASKMIGKGTKFFLAQLLMGDTADNVQGILKLHGKLCGEAGAFDALSPINDEHEAVNFVIDGYRKINQNIIPEAEAMWLLRNPKDSSYIYLSEHDLTPDNKAFLDECYHERKWRNELEIELDEH